MEHLINSIITERENAIKRIINHYEEERKKAFAINLILMRDNLIDRVNQNTNLMLDYEDTKDILYNDLCELENTTDFEDEVNTNIYENACEELSKHDKKVMRLEEVNHCYVESLKLLDELITLFEYIEKEEKRGF